MATYIIISKKAHSLVASITAKNYGFLIYMNYKKIHDSLIERAKNRKTEEYTETHHIIPRCMGGTNDKTNLVELTAREHFLIHRILCVIYPENKGIFYAY